MGAKGGAPLFHVETYSKRSSEDGQARATEKLTARYVVWAAGEFQYPREGARDIVGTELCTHNSRVRSWAQLPGDAWRAARSPAMAPGRLRAIRAS